MSFWELFLFSILLFMPMIVFATAFVPQVILDRLGMRLASLSGRYTRAMVVATLLVAAGAYIKANYDKGKRMEVRSGYEIVLENNERVSSTKHHFYIGATKNYTFFYNDSLRITSVYPKHLISLVTIKDVL